jgi:hypothetical protein
VIVLIALAALSLVGIVATIRDAGRDGHRRVPTRR